MKLIASSIGQAREGCSFVLIHIVEALQLSFTAKETADFETEKMGRLESFVDGLKQRGYDAKGVPVLRTAPAIVRIVKEEQADLLVLGAHGPYRF